MLLPFIELVEGKPNGNTYLGLYYYNTDFIKSVEPSEEGNVRVYHLDGTFETFAVAPIDFYKLIVKLEGSVNLNCLEECKKIDKFTVEKLTQDFSIKSI